MRIAKARQAAARVRPGDAAVTDVRTVVVSLVLGLVLATIGACVAPSGNIDVPTADPAVFRETIYPILLRDCGFNTCHGTSERFFSVFGPGRARLDPATVPYDPATPYELAHSYTRARSMLLDPDGPGSSLLVRKPIPEAQGGAGHKGDDPWGDSVYASTGDPSFIALYSWATASEAQ